ncbi:hypothetical protein BZA70DRAFT_265483 [Myxozyma melibiosi]|uniref:Uncharacterized protein n=1 Tax=Myxozyma melibiosi TaxID=54550 RepID=A0ABR1FEA0_9ASCO
MGNYYGKKLSVLYQRRIGGNLPSEGTTDWVDISRSTEDVCASSFCVVDEILVHKPARVRLKAAAAAGVRILHRRRDGLNRSSEAVVVDDRVGCGDGDEHGLDYSSGRDHDDGGWAAHDDGTASSASSAGHLRGFEVRKDLLYEGDESAVSRIITNDEKPTNEAEWADGGCKSRLPSLLAHAVPHAGNAHVQRWLWRLIMIAAIADKDCVGLPPTVIDTAIDYGYDYDYIL